ncbi:MAG TPA: right-handed parallel beta-helix repeat-containing protein, partial [Saprospiraceae bacterium]|nr:right-handed parallel beta-helix repeat-containing protein [Saprospiraceae bacterium]
MTHRTISGKVSDLIASNDLNANSCTQPIGNDRIIQGELEIDQDFCFLGVSTDPISIYLLPGARIEVKPGKTLTLNHVNIFTCDQLAEGIIVETGGKLIAQYVNFNDMRFAVNAQSASSLDIRNCNFTNNYVGLHLDMTGAPAGQEQVSFLGFSGNTFSTAPGQALKAAYPGMPEAIEERGYCGIFLKNYRDFNVFGANSFERLANGIVATNTNLNVGNLTFSDMRHSGVVNAYPREGHGIHLSARNNSSWANIGLPWAPMNFDDCKTAVYAERYAGKVEHCTMTGVDLGIDWQKSPTRDVRIRDNDITANRYGVRSFLNEPTHNSSNIKDNEVTIEGQGDELEPVTGIQLNEVTGGNIGNGWKIDTNSVTLKNGGWGIAYRNGSFGNIRGNIVLNEDPGAGNFNGLKIEGVANSAVSANNIDGGGASGISNCILSSAGWANTIQCNCLNNSDIGIQFLDEADFTDAVRGNHFFTHCYGLQIGAPGIDTAYSAYIGTQEYQGNLWELDTNSMLCTYGGINYANPEESTFIVNGVANQQCNPPVTPVSLWFFSLTKQDNYNGCGACSAPGTPPRVVETGAPTGIDEAIVQDSLPTDLLNWKGRYRLYRKILRWPVMDNQSSYAGFKSAHSNQSTGQLAYIAEQRSGLFALTPTQQSSINAQSGAFLQHMIALRTLDSLRLTGIPVNENSYADLVTQRNTAATQLEALY